MRRPTLTGGAGGDSGFEAYSSMAEQSFPRVEMISKEELLP